MIRKAFSKFETDFSISKAAFIIAVFTILSRLTGLFRTRLLTSTFGAGDTLDVYYASFRIPDFAANLLVLGTLSVAFMPVFAQFLVKDKKEANIVASTVLHIAFVGMTVVCGILFIFAEPLTKWLVPGFSAEQLSQAIMMTRLILFSQVIFAVSNVFTSILNSYKRFFIATLAPILYNAGIIVGLLYLYPAFGLKGLGYGVIFGAVLHLVIQLPAAAQAGFAWKPLLAFNHPGIRQVIKLYIPRIFAIDNAQASLIISAVLGSLLSSGSITVFNLAFDLQAVPVGVFALSTAIATFPALSESFARNNSKEYWDTLRRAIVQILFIMIPVSVLMLLFRAYIVRIIYGGGEFNWDDTTLTFQVLGIFTFSLFSQSLIPLFARAFYARHNTKIPVLVALASIILNAGLSYALTPHFGVLGVALGFTIASLFNCLVLYSILRLQLTEQDFSEGYVHEFDAQLMQATVKIIFASFVMGLVSYGALYFFAPALNTRTGVGILVQSGAAGLLGVATFLLACLALKLEESERLINFFKRLLRLS